MLWISATRIPDNLVAHIKPNDCQRAYTELITQNANDLHVNLYYHNWKHSSATPLKWSVDAVSKDEQFHTGREDLDLCKALSLVWKDIEVYNAYITRDSRE
jgi:hypothetical protein